MDCSRRTPPILEDTYWGRPIHPLQGTWGLEPGGQREQARGIPPRESESARRLWSPETKRVWETRGQSTALLGWGGASPSPAGDQPTFLRMTPQKSGFMGNQAAHRPGLSAGLIGPEALCPSAQEQRQQEGSRKALWRPYRDPPGTWGPWMFSRRGRPLPVSIAIPGVPPQLPSHPECGREGASSVPVGVGQARSSQAEPTAPGSTERGRSPASPG